MNLPDLPPYAPENEDLPTPPEGQVLHKLPQDVKYMRDPFWYDTLGRTLIEQRKILTKPRSDEERAAMIDQALKDAADAEDEADADTGEDVDEEYRAETLQKRIESIALEAAIKNSPAVMKHLIANYGLKAEEEDEDESSLALPTHIASRDGFIEVLEVLFDEAGVDIDVEDGNETPLYMAAYFKQVKVLKWLLNRGAQPLRPVFHAAAASGDMEIIQILFAAVREKEPDTPISTWLSKENFLGSAAQGGSEEMMLLIAETAGFGPAASNTEDMRKVALEAIPTAIRNDKTNQRCLELAIGYALPKNDDGSFVKSDEPEVIEMISSAASNSCSRVKPNEMEQMLQLLLDATNMTKKSSAFKEILNQLLHWCRPPRAEECARKLLEEWGASPNVNDSDEDFAIVLAQAGVDSGNKDYLKFWLQHGADIHRAYGEYCNGPTALARAVETRQADLAMGLMEWGGPVDRIEPGLVGKKEVWLKMSNDELQSVELVAPATTEEEGNEDEDEDDSTSLVLKFEDGVTEEWLHKIQLRRSDEELAKDGSGRPLKDRDGNTEE